MAATHPLGQKRCRRMGTPAKELYLKKLEDKGNCGNTVPFSVGGAMLKVYLLFKIISFVVTWVVILVWILYKLFKWFH